MEEIGPLCHLDLSLLASLGSLVAPPLQELQVVQASQQAPVHPMKKKKKCKKKKKKNNTHKNGHKVKCHIQYVLLQCVTEI